jgi:hypothetical protein
VNLKKQLLAWVSLVIFLLACACHCQQEKKILGHLQLDIPNYLAALNDDLDYRKTRKIIRESLDDDPHFRFDPDKESALTLKISIFSHRDGAKEILSLSSSIYFADEEAQKVSVAELLLGPDGISEADLKHALRQSLQDLWLEIQGKSADKRHFIERVSQAAKGETVDQKELILAIELSAESKTKEALESIGALLLASRDLAVANACLNALGKMKNENAMPAIIDFASRKPPIFVRQAILAARKIASVLAAQWLYVLALGHDDEMVRKEAMAAFKELEHIIPN